MALSPGAPHYVLLVDCQPAAITHPAGDLKPPDAPCPLTPLQVQEITLDSAGGTEEVKIEL